MYHPFPRSVKGWGFRNPHSFTLLSEKNAVLFELLQKECKFFPAAGKYFAYFLVRSSMVVLFRGIQKEPEILQGCVYDFRRGVPRICNSRWTKYPVKYIIKHCNYRHNKLYYINKIYKYNLYLPKPHCTHPIKVFYFYKISIPIFPCADMFFHVFDMFSMFLTCLWHDNV